MPDYIQWIRAKVGHEKIFLNFVAACIVNEHGEVLLQKRSDFRAWGLPGGAIEIGESAAEALAREVLEETGLEVTIEKLIGVYTDGFITYPNGDEAQPILISFFCRPAGVTMRSDGQETLDLAYMSPEIMPTLFSKQHHATLNDYLHGRFGSYR